MPSGSMTQLRSTPNAFTFVRVLTFAGCAALLFGCDEGSGQPREIGRCLFFGEGPQP